MHLYTTMCALCINARHALCVCVCVCVCVCAYPRGERMKVCECMGRGKQKTCADFKPERSQLHKRFSLYVLSLGKLSETLCRQHAQHLVGYIVTGLSVSNLGYLSETLCLQEHTTFLIKVTLSKGVVCRAWGDCLRPFASKTCTCTKT